MALATYSDLIASIATWLNRSDLTSVIPDFVTLAEARVARDLRLRKLVSTATLTCTASVQTVALPTDLLEIENLTITNASPPRTLSVITPELMDVKFPEAYWVGVPTDYTIIGDNLVLGPTPDSAYTISVSYYPRNTALSSASTNWLLTNHPGIYLSAALHEAYAYLHDEERAIAWLQKYKLEADALMDYDDATLRSGSAMRVRVV